MALTEIPIELSSTPSIVDGGNATAITIDSSENVIVNRTSVFTTAKMEIQSDTGDASTLALNSIDTDGSILEFYKAGTTVGSIKSVSGVTLGVDGGGARSGLQLNAGSVDPRYNGSGSDNAIDLGRSDSRYKDLYLSGGVVFGTTGGAVSSKTLDDYEEGTWTPTLVGSTGSSGTTYTTQTGKYVRVGNVMTAEFSMKLSSKGTTSGTVSIGGLPVSVSNVECAGRPAYYANITLATGGSISLRWSGSNVLQLRQLSSTTASTVNISELDSNFDIRGSITAIVA